MMSAFVERAMGLAYAAATAAVRGSFLPGGYASACDKLRAHLEAREAVTRQLAEALTSLVDLYDTDEGCKTLSQYVNARAALQAYDEASK